MAIPTLAPWHACPVGDVRQPLASSSTCVDGHAHTETIEQYLAAGAGLFKVSCGHHLGKRVAAQSEGPFLAEQPLLNVEAVQHLQQPIRPGQQIWGMYTAGCRHCNPGHPIQAIAVLSEKVSCS
jgi:hypothetical protein